MYYYQYLKEKQLIDDSGYFATERQDNFYPMFCEEVDIINAIAENEGGYFDTSKNLIDVGCDMGCYTWLTHFNHSYCFEPNKESLYYIHANLLLHNRIDDVTTYNVGLSNVNGTMLFDGFNTNNDNNICFDPEKSYEIEVKTLDSFNINNVGLIKVDVEGNEENVLRGGIRTIIRNNYPPILFECWDVGFFNMSQEKRDSLFKFIESLGYEILEYWGDHETHLAIKRN